jgi:glutamine amidotransferase
MRTSVPGSQSQLLSGAKEALRAQSRQHGDGWGVGWYRDGSLTVQRRLLPAGLDPFFGKASAWTGATTALAHLRRASSGGLTMENVHPFRYRRWLFCHNGTVSRFSQVARELEREIDPHLQVKIQGETDSERCFYLFLTQLSVRARLDRPVEVGEVVGALARTISLIRTIADRPGHRASSLTFLVSDGEVLAASRLGRTLTMASVPGALLLASEPLPGVERWQQVPEEGLVATDGSLRVVRAPLREVLLRKDLPPVRRVA